MGEFIGRNQELVLLNRLYDKGSDMVLLTGRRRVGKTRLLKEFMKGKDSLYFLATNATEADMLKEFWDCVRPPEGMGNPTGWKDAFRSTINGKRRVLIIDEFSYMAKMNESFLIVFQGVFDEILKGSGVMVILCGSHMSVMKKLSDDENSPLYGRFDRKIVLRPLPFQSIPSTDDIRHDIEMYSIHGGVPRYMELLDFPTVRENVLENIMEPSSTMFSDPLVIMQSDAGGSNVYLSILKAVAEGNTRSSEISSALEMPSGKLSPYISKLIEVGMLEKEMPVTDTKDNSKNSRYRVSDYYTAFWFRFIYPYRSALMRDDTVYAISRFDTDFIQRHVAFVYEDICRESMRMHYDRIGFVPERVGRYWSKNVEIEVIAIDDNAKKVFLGECKYKSDSVVDRHKLNELKSKASKIREISDYEKTYGLFSVSGFSEDLENEDVVLFGPEDIFVQ